MLLKLRYFFRLFIAFIKRFKTVLFGGIIFGILIFIFLNLYPIGKAMTRVEKIGLVGRYRSDDLPREILNMISEGLTLINQSGEVEPSIAKNWETPDKGKTWIFHLNKDIKWQDGKNLLSGDLNYQFSDVTIEKPDNYTIVFKLKDYLSPFPSIVSLPVFKKGLLGTGDWQVKKMLVSGGYVQKLYLFHRNGQKKMLRFYPTEESAKLGFKLGQINILQDIHNPNPFPSWKTVKVSNHVKQNRVAALFFNTSDKLMSEKSFRQALIYTIDKEDYAEHRAFGPISPSSWGYNPQVKQYPYDVSKAKEMINNLPDDLKDNLRINFVTTPTLLTEGEHIVNQWKNVGLDINLLVSLTIPSEFQVFLAILEIPNDPDQYAIWHSTQKSSNISNYHSPRIDKLLEDGRNELDLEKRKKIYLDFQRFIVEDSPAAFLYHPIVYKIERKNLFR